MFETAQRFSLVAAACVTGSSMADAVLPEELPLWPEGLPTQAENDVSPETERVYSANPDAPSGSNRVFSSVSVPTYSLHRPQAPNGVGLVICPGGGFRDVWLDREGHDLALVLKEYGITSLVLKYRTRPAGEADSSSSGKDYQREVQADGRQALRVLRRQARELGLDPDKIGICGFSAGGHLAASCAIYPEPTTADVRGEPDFAGLFYPGIPEGIEQAVRDRGGASICPLFIMNARVDRLTPAERCIAFYGVLLEEGVNAELHVYGKGSHGFDLGRSAGASAARWPASFVAWLVDNQLMRRAPAMP